MTAYLMVDVRIGEMAAYRDSGYLEAAVRIAARHGGVYRLRGGTVEVLEGSWRPSRMAMIEFPSMADLHGFVDDPEYAPWKAVRHRLADSDMVAFEVAPGSLPAPG